MCRFEEFHVHCAKSVYNKTPKRTKSLHADMESARLHLSKIEYCLQQVFEFPANKTLRNYQELILIFSTMCLPF